MKSYVPKRNVGVASGVRRSSIVEEEMVQR
jgi:hypothetical protein